MNSDVDLKFEEIKAIQFGSLKVKPKKADAERELRLRALDLSIASGQEEAKGYLSECFEGGHAKEIKKFMDDNMTSIQLSVLQAYLIGGKQVVEMTLQNATARSANG